LLVTVVETAVVIEPGVCTLDHPTHRHNSEAFAVVGTEDDLQLKATVGRHLIQELTTVAASDPDDAQFFAGASELREQEPSVVPVLGRTSGDQHRQQQTDGVNQEMTFRTTTHYTPYYP
jgi:hypothetical protein